MSSSKPQYGLGASKPGKTFRRLYLPFMLLLGLGSMVFATQRIAAYFSYQSALGKPPPRKRAPRARPRRAGRRAP